MAHTAKVLVFQGKPAVRDLALTRSGTLGGAIRVAEGSMPAGVSIRLWTETWQLVGAIQADASGTFRFEAVPPGSYIVSLDVPTGYTAERHETAVKLTGKDRVDVTFLLRASGDLRGRVVRDIFGAPLAGVGLEVVDGTGRRIATGTTSETGDYEFAGLVGDSFSVRLSE